MDFKPGNIVMVESPSNFQGPKIGVVLDKQKWCRDGIPVMLAQKDITTRSVCVMFHLGDTITLVSKNNGDPV